MKYWKSAIFLQSSTYKLSIPPFCNLWHSLAYWKSGFIFATAGTQYCNTMEYNDHLMSDFKSLVCFCFFPKDLKSGYPVTGKIIDMPFFPDPFECPKIGLKVQYGKIKILFWHFPKLLKTYRGQRMHNFLHIAITLWHFRKVKHILFWSLNIFSQCIFVS